MSPRTVPSSGRSDPAGSLAIRVLGPLEVLVDGAPIVVDTRKALAILAVLAVERRPFARDEIAALLWPDADDESARGSLRRTLSVLRAALGDRWLRVDRSAVELDVEAARIDLHAIEAATSASGTAELQAAADQARGPFLAGFTLRDSAPFDDWRATRAVAVERSVAALLDRLAADAEANGDDAAALAAAARRVDLDPLDEAAHRRLMALLARSGDRAGAIRQYRVCVGVLERELGVAPLAETTEVYEAIRDARSDARVTRPAVAAPAPVPLVREPMTAATPAPLPMVGRQDALASLLEAHRASAPDGRVVVITGEAGIGKSRLVEAVVEAVEAEGGHALVARAYPAEAGIAYGPVVELLRTSLARPDAGDRVSRLSPRTRDELERVVALPARPAARETSSAPASTSGDPAGRVRLVEALADGLTAMVAGDRPGVVALEDLQWADEATHALLAWLARRLTGRPILLVLTWRPEDLDDLGAAFAASLDAVPGVQRLGLDRLDLDAVAELVTAATARGIATPSPDGLLEESEGLPLFVVEALVGGDSNTGDGGGRTVRALIRDRLASVSETGSQVLATAAVIGRSFEIGLARAASGRTEDETIGALEELVRRGLVRELASGSDLTFDFAHARFREATYDGISLVRRRLLHRRVADLLRADPHGRDDPGRLVQVAVHERAAGRDAEAAEAFRDAGLRAREVHALHEAGTHLETALALGHPDVVGIQSALGEVRTAQGDYAGAIGALEAAAAVADEGGLPSIELRLGRVHARRGDPATAASHLDAAIDAPGPHDRPGRSVLVHALVERALVAVSAGDLDLADATAGRALEIAEADGDVASIGAVHRVRGLVARSRGDLDAARTSLRTSLELASSASDPGAAIAAGNALALVEAEADDPEAAIVLLEAALATSRRTGELHLEAAVENNLADQLHAVGRQDEAMVHLKRAVALFADVGGRPE